MYLLDTNIVSILWPGRRVATPLLAEWLERHTGDLYLSAITIAEIEEGIVRTRREGARRKADDLQAWLESLLDLYVSRVLPVDIEIARLVGSLSDLARSKGRPPGLADIIVAATARRHGLTIVTRNLRHFVPLGVAVFDPYDTLPP